MSFAEPGVSLSDIEQTRYGTSRLNFRGPKRDLSEDYIAFLGGTETYGKFVNDPFAAHVERQIGMTCLNLGFPQAGVDAYLYDSEVMRIAQQARAVVLQLAGAQNVSNRFYRVHPRRNDRFVSASERLMTLYPDVDFTEFHFTKHMLSALKQRCADRFSLVESELQKAWEARTALLMRVIERPVVALHLRCGGQGDLGGDPLFVTAPMVDRLRDLPVHMIEMDMPPADMQLGRMDFTPFQIAEASAVPGPAAHRALARKLAPLLLPYARHEKRPAG